MNEEQTILQRFWEFLNSKHPAKSGAPNSYVTALTIVDEALKKDGRFLARGENLWDIHSQARLQEIYNLVISEQRKLDGIFQGIGAPSYHLNGYCSAALRSFAKFLVETQQAQNKTKPITLNSLQNSRILDEYLDFQRNLRPDGSGTPGSYVMALKIINAALKRDGRFLETHENIWDVRNQDRMLSIYNFVKSEQRKESGGIFHDVGSTSYYEKGFCSAAVRSFSRFLTISQVQNEMMAMIDAASDAQILARDLSAVRIPANQLLASDGVVMFSPEWNDAMRNVRDELNQEVYRRMVFDNYHNRCCLTGLPVREAIKVGRISLSEKTMTMNPENGLCLAATYQSAFENHLMSFDEDYRMILAPSAKEHYTGEAFRIQFLALEGTRIETPKRFFPSQELLARHRNKLA